MLISADAPWERGFGVIFPGLEGESGFTGQQAILECIVQFDVPVMIPGHGQPFTNVGTAIDASLGRFAYLRIDPERNTLHAIRMLVKFRLLEQQALSHEALFAWFAQATLMPCLHTRFSTAQSMGTLLDAAIAALVKVGTVTVEHDRILNHD